MTHKKNKDVWVLVHLRRACILKPVLLKICCTSLRPLLENCSVVFYPMLCSEISNQIERLQKRALRLIYGFDFNYETLLEQSGIQTLKARKEAACASFALKLSNSDRFSDWLPLREVRGPELRRRNIYEEYNSRTSRLVYYNSTLFHIRRILNQETK